MAETTGRAGQGVGADLPVLSFDSGAAWAAWLEEHQGEPAGLWLRIAKKATGAASVSYAEALEIALCYGWIDGQKATADEGWWRQRFSPRRPRSRWSQVNRAAAERLIDAGRMLPAGLREVERAKADGRWEAAYEPASTAAVPPDLQQALDVDPQAAAFFATLTGANRYAILYRLQDAKRPQTRARRLEQFMQLLREGRTLH